MKRPFTFINSGLAEIPFHAALARELAKEGYPSHAVTLGSRFSGPYRQAGCYAQVHDLAEWMRDHWDPQPGPLVEQARQVESRYGQPGLWQYLAADRRLCLRDHDFNLRVACSQALFWEEHLRAVRPQLLVGEISHFHNYLAWAVGHSQGTPYAHLIPARIPGHTAIGDGPFEHRNLVRKRYEAFQQGGVPAEFRQKAEAHIQAFRSREQRAAHLAPVRSWYQDPVDIGTLPTFLQNTRAWLSWEGDYNYGLIPPTAKLKTWAMQRLRRAVMAGGRYFDSLEGRDAPFVLFGLHLQPESSTLVRGQFFQNMLAVAQNAALSLPAGFRLYVKEHDVMYGQRPLEFFRALRRIPNVVVVSPYESGPHLVRQAAAVVTVTGTLGWDAALLGKPAIVLGESFFNMYRGVDHVTDLTHLPRVLHERLRHFEHDPEELLTFVAAVFASIVPASLDDLWGFREASHEGDAAVLARALIERAATSP
jgi:hypothetical protein